MGASAGRSSPWAVGEGRGHCPLRGHVRMNRQPPMDVPLLTPGAASWDTPAAADARLVPERQMPSYSRVVRRRSSWTRGGWGSGTLVALDPPDDEADTTASGGVRRPAQGAKEQSMASTANPCCGASHSLGVPSAAGTTVSLHGGALLRGWASSGARWGRVASKPSSLTGFCACGQCFPVSSWIWSGRRLSGRQTRPPSSCRWARRSNRFSSQLVATSRTAP